MSLEEEELVIRRTVSFVTGNQRGNEVRRGNTLDSERESLASGFSPISPNMKNFRNAESITITESCPS